jgi:hypothetical protein
MEFDRLSLLIAAPSSITSLEDSIGFSLASARSLFQSGGPTNALTATLPCTFTPTSATFTLNCASTARLISILLAPARPRRRDVLPSRSMRLLGDQRGGG